MLPLSNPQAAVICRNKDKGAETRRICSAGCLGCGKCVKTCEHDAIKIENFLASVDYEKCIGCGKCTEVCPVKCIDIVKVG